MSLQAQQHGGAGGGAAVLERVAGGPVDPAQQPLQEVLQAGRELEVRELVLRGAAVSRAVLATAVAGPRRPPVHFEIKRLAFRRPLLMNGCDLRNVGYHFLPNGMHLKFMFEQTVIYFK